LYVVDNIGAKHPFQINTNQFSAKNDMYTQINSPLVVTPLEDQLKLMKEKQEAIRFADLAVMTKKFRRAIDSLSTMTKEVVVLHHPFDQVYVVKEDLEAYYGLIEKVKKMKGKKIVIVSAADCTGDEAYNDDLSKRRANRIYKTFSHLSDNEVVTKSVGEMELLNDCNDINNQQKNRYSYVFIVNK
jgi:outer membrane protein OmpA-like peptidoglycan-associated protein